MDLLVRHAVDFTTRGERLFDDLLANARGVQAAAVVGDADDDIAAFMESRQLDGAVGRLADIDAFLRRLQAVVGAVADHVGQRIADQFQHLAVQLGAFALHDEVDLLVQFVGEVAHQARQLLPGGADGLHARLHDAVLQFPGQGRQALQRRGERRIFTGTADLQELVAGQHHFRDQGHQAFEHVDRDADRLGRGDALGVFTTQAGQRLGGGDWLGRFDLGRSGRVRGFRRLGGDRRFLFLGLLALLGLVFGDGFGRVVHPVGTVGGGKRRFEVGFGDFTRAQGAAGRGIDIADAERRGDEGDGFGFRSDRTIRYVDGMDRRQVDFLALGHGFELGDQVVIVAVRFRTGRFQAVQDQLDAVDRVQDQRHRYRRDVQLAVTEAAQQGFAGVRHGFEARQAQEATGALHGVNEAKNVVERLAVVRIGFEPDQFAIDDLEAFSGLGQKFGD